MTPSEIIPKNNQTSFEPSGTGMTMEEEMPEATSPWLYLAGLLVLLSAVYAINFDRDDPLLSILTYGLSICGVVFSYLFRNSGKSFSANTWHILLAAALILVMTMLFQLPIAGSAGEGGTDRTLVLQTAILWVTVVFTFFLSDNKKVLFLCVPCITLLSLVNIYQNAQEVQFAFFTFVGAATFLAVHENYLRTRTEEQRGRIINERGNLFGGQLQLVAYCLIGSMLLANLVSIPLRIVGGGIAALGSMAPPIQNQQTPTSSSPVVATMDTDEIFINNGPVSENDVQVFRLDNVGSGYLHGTSYDFYTGTGFRNSVNQRVSIIGTSNTVDISEQLLNQFNMQFEIPVSQYELDAGNLLGKPLMQQQVTVLTSLVSQFYGAGMMRYLHTNSLRRVSISEAGSVTSENPQDINSSYMTRSYVPNADPASLRKSETAVGTIPEQIQQRYLQLSPNGLANPNLQALAQRLTQNENTNYDKVLALKQYISSTCKYNLLAQAAPSNVDRVEYFLTQGNREGYCDSFASALAMLCRYVGIPARLTAGFLIQEKEIDGSYIVRHRDKHVWTEVYFNEIGWVPFDATEGAPDVTPKEDPNAQRRQTFLQWFAKRGWMILLGSAVLLAGGAFILYNEFKNRFRTSEATTLTTNVPPTNREIVQHYIRACKLLARRGLVRPDSMTPAEFATLFEHRLPQEAKPLSEAMQKLTGLHADFRYSTSVADATNAQQAKSYLDALKEGLAKLPRKALRLLPPT